MAALAMSMMLLIASIQIIAKIGVTMCAIIYTVVYQPQTNNNDKDISKNNTAEDVVELMVGV